MWLPWKQKVNIKVAEDVVEEVVEGVAEVEAEAVEMVEEVGVKEALILITISLKNGVSLRKNKE